MSGLVGEQEESGLEFCSKCKVPMVYVVFSGKKTGPVPVLAEIKTAEPEEFSDPDGERPPGRVQVEYSQMEWIEEGKVEVYTLVPEGDAPNADRGPVLFVHWATCPLKKAATWRKDNGI